MFSKISTLITNKKFECKFGKYHLICKIGEYHEFGLEQISNERHAHSSYELCLILRGKGKFIYSDSSFDIAAKDIVLADPHIAHEIICDHYDGLLLLYIFIDVHCLESASPISCTEDILIDEFLKHHVCIYHSSSKVLPYLDFINTYAHTSSTFNYGLYQITKTLIMECLQALTINKVTSLPHVVPSTTLEKAQDYIDAHLHTKIYVGDIARHCSISVRSLQYIFKKELNVSVIDYINQHKIKLASHYLLNHFSIVDTADLVGLSDISHFNRVFKKLTGFTPSQLQKLGKYNHGFGRRL
ncbi:MAG: AraC family transcriptional regulator [Clostridia bacterium]|jgi:AraC-like DNA-binding protein|nr:AraC family transcriptional regulator [Clostridia bacterium]